MVEVLFEAVFAISCTLFLVPAHDNDECQLRVTSKSHGIAIRAT